MYYIIYPIFYLLSLLPWRVMYFISDGVYGLLYYIIGYRKEVVMNNLLIAFPEKTEQERVRIAKDFYHNLVDTFIEVIKLISISEKQVRKRFTADLDLLHSYYEKGVNVQLQAGHFFSWEFINMGISATGKFPFVGVYMPISNKVFDRMMMNLRQRFGTILVPATNFKANFKAIVRGRYALGLAADQNPGGPTIAYWVPFFNRLTPFVTGPEKGARISGIPILFANFYKVKRGYYHIEFEYGTDKIESLAPGELTKQYAAFVERCVRKRPANYLWSHRRWKWVYEDKYAEHRVI